MDAFAGINLAALAAQRFNTQRAIADTADRDHGARSGDVARGHRHGHVHRGCDANGCVDAASAAPSVQPGAAESATALTYRRTEKTTLYIQTQEGDTVRLKIKAREAVDAASATAQSGDTVVSELQLAARSSAKISISVDGNLNPDELAAIQSVVEQAGELADAFFDGNLQSAFSDAAALQIDASQLSQVGLRFSVREQLTYAHLGAPRALPAPAPAPANVPAAAPAAAVTAEGAAPEVATASTTATEAPAVDAASTVAADNSPPLSAAAGVQQTIAGFLNQLLNALGTAAQPQDGATSGASIHMALKIKIFQSVLMTASSSATAPADAGTAQNNTPSALPALVPETLDALAAQQQPPLSAAA